MPVGALGAGQGAWEGVTPGAIRIKSSRVHQAEPELLLSAL